MQLPISPELIDGRLAHLIPILGLDKSFPVARPKSPPVSDEGIPVWWVESKGRTQSVEVYARLGVGAVFAGHASANYSMTVEEIQVGLWAHSQDPEASVVATFWGVGLRVALTYAAFEGDTNLNAGLAAAHVETKGMQVNYHIESIGLGRKELASVLKVFPALDKFDMGAYSKLQQVRDQLVNALTERLATPAMVEVLQPTIVELATAPLADTLGEAAEWRLVMQSIAAKLSLADTLKRIGNGQWTNVRRSEVEKIYLEWTENKTTPSPSNVSDASNWLQM